MNLDMNTIMNLASVLGNGSGFPAGGNAGQGGDMMSMLTKMMGGGAAQNAAQSAPQNDAPDGREHSSSDYNNRYSEQPRFARSDDRYSQNRDSQNTNYRGYGGGDYVKSGFEAFDDGGVFNRGAYYGQNYGASTPQNGGARARANYGNNSQSESYNGNNGQKIFDEYARNNFAAANGLGAEINFNAHKDSPKSQNPPPQQNALQNMLPMLMNMMSKPAAKTASADAAKQDGEKPEELQKEKEKETNARPNDCCRPENEEDRRGEHYKKHENMRGEHSRAEKNPQFFHEKSGKRAFSTSRGQGLRPIHFAGYELLSAFEKLRLNANKRRA